MILAVASGKGGTGKTTVAASLASVWDRPLTVVDLDVEEPNLHLFLRPELGAPEPIYLEVPREEPGRCTHCGACGELCQFKAISLLGETLLVFPEMCHGCGGCFLACPSGALARDRRELGEVAAGRAGERAFLLGRLRVGEAQSPPLMRAVKARLARELAALGGDALLDCPPGVSCPAVNAVRDADLVLLVTEPTPFGLHDLRLAVESFAPLGRPLGVVVNRAGLGDRGVHAFCVERGLPILAEFPHDRRVAEAYSRGEVPARTLPWFGAACRDLLARARGLAAAGAPRGGGHA